MADTYELLVTVGKTVRAKGGWSYIEDFSVGYVFQAGDYQAKIVAKTTDPGYPATGYDDAYEQGSQFEAFIVIEIEGQFFKKTGTGDSYSNISWDGDLMPVQVKEKTVTVYEYE